MSKDSNNQSFRIKIQGHLDLDWTEWFDGLSFTHQEDGTTVLTGSGLDQAALHGLLAKVRDLGLTLLSVESHRPEPDAPDKQD